jgi:hypothetical protein
MVQSRTMEDLARILHGRDYKLFMSHNLPIPDCFNQVVSDALEAGYDTLWMVEEDMALPEGILDEMLTVGKPVVTANYPVAPGVGCVIKHEDFTQFGTGCLLIKREVFDKLDTPYFQAKLFDAYTFEPVAPHPHMYGGHDIDFAIRVKKAGYDVAVTRTTVGQYKVTELGTPNNNHGAHNVETWAL